MAYTSTLEATASRAAIARGDGQELERYLREGGHNPVQTISAATGNLIPGTNLINKATGGFTYLLPQATGSQAVVKAVIQTAITSGNGIIKTATNADFMTGMMVFATTVFATAPNGQAIGGTNALITLVAASGGVKGTIITFTDIAPNLWLVEGYLNSTTAAQVVGAWA